MLKRLRKWSCEMLIGCLVSRRARCSGRSGCDTTDEIAWCANGPEPPTVCVWPVLIGVVDLPRNVTSRKTAQQLAATAIRFRDEVLLHPAASAVADELQDAAEEILRLTEKIRLAERQLKALVTAIASDLLSVHGISSVVAAGLIGHTGDLRNYRNAGAFAAKCGAAPVPCSSGRRIAVRVNTGGDRQLNRLLHVVAIAQVATKQHPGRQYYERKRGEGKTHPAAMRCLKRQLATVVYYRLSAVQQLIVAADLSRAEAA